MKLNDDETFTYPGAAIDTLSQFVEYRCPRAVLQDVLGEGEEKPDWQAIAVHEADAVIDLKMENARLRAALAFYEPRERYQWFDISFHLGEQSPEEMAATVPRQQWLAMARELFEDAGQRAREALNQPE